MKHCLQYAIVDTSPEYEVYNTEKLSDEEIIKKVPWFAKSSNVSRFNRCPICEVWTTSGGKIRQDINCPAIWENKGLIKKI